MRCPERGRLQGGYVTAAISREPANEPKEISYEA